MVARIFRRMQSLRQYLNSLSVPDQTAYAKRCGTTIGYLRKAITVKQRMKGALCRRLHEESGGKVLLEDLQPEIWAEK
jgi:hypothetical protein